MTNIGTQRSADPGPMRGKEMKRFILVLVLPLAACGACTRHKPAVDQVRPYAAEQSAARDRVPQRYDANHDPNNTMSINSMGSD